MMYNSVLQYLKKSAKDYPDKVALVDGDEEIAYGKLYEKAGKIGTYLSGRVGNEKRPVVVLMEKCADAIVSFWGILRSGNIYVPLDAYAPVSRINTILSFVEPALVIVDELYQEKTAELNIEKDKILFYKDLQEFYCWGFVLVHIILLGLV